MRVIDKINAADGSGFEKDIDELVCHHGGKSLVATDSYERAIRETDVTYILVATPSNDDDHFSIAFLEQAFRSLAQPRDNPAIPSLAWGMKVGAGAIML